MPSKSQSSTQNKVFHSRSSPLHRDKDKRGTPLNGHVAAQDSFPVPLRGRPTVVHVACRAQRRRTRRHASVAVRGVPARVATATAIDRDQTQGTQARATGRDGHTASCPLALAPCPPLLARALRALCLVPANPSSACCRQPSAQGTSSGFDGCGAATPHELWCCVIT
jgi:hypothetical protein